MLRQPSGVKTGPVCKELLGDLCMTRRGNGRFRPSPRDVGETRSHPQMNLRAIVGRPVGVGVGGLNRIWTGLQDLQDYKCI